MKNRKFDFFLSVGIHGMFICLWCASILAVSKRIGLNNIESYLALCLVGVFSVIWCYFSWDAERIFVKPHKASKHERKAKKVFIYFLILVFVLVQGYHQTLHAINNTYQVNPIFSVTNYSIIVATIAFDRIMNQLFGN